MQNVIHHYDFKHDNICIHKNKDLKLYKKRNSFKAWDCVDPPQKFFSLLNWTQRNWF
jgi:hypothetical protein